MISCAECGKETWDVHYCQGKGCDKWICNDCGPVCSSCVEHQKALKEIEEEEKRWKPMETVKAVDKAVSKAVGQAAETAAITGYRLWSKACGKTLRGLSLFNRFSSFFDSGGDGEIGTDVSFSEEPDISEQEVSSEEENTAEETADKIIEGSPWFDYDEEVVEEEEEEVEDDTEEDENP